MSESSAPLRDEVEAATLGAAERMGVDGIDKAAIVKPFLGRAARSTLYRWVDVCIALGQPGQHATRKLKEAAAARAEALDVPSAAATVVTKLPARLTAGEVTGQPAIAIMQKLCSIVADVERVTAHAKTDDGKVRNARLLLTASETLRRCLETATRIAEAMHEVDQVERLHAAVFEEIAKLSPETAEAIFRRIDAIAAQWGG